jgi:ABC-type lipoprotein export system ATPase subunit
MNDQYTYARFWRCALQVNTVGYSRACRGEDHGMTEDVYNQALAQKCQDLDIKVMGLADHGHVDSVDKLRKVLSERGVVVFPGFEISSTEKIHMVCLFSEKTSQAELNRYLGDLGLTDLQETVRPSGYSCIQLAEKIKAQGGFWYAAHATQASGILCQKSVHTWQRGDWVKAAQIPGSIDELPQEYKSIVLNTDPNWKRERPIAVINARDVAKPSDLDDAGATCWIKMTHPTFDAFKVAFLDPESRIRLNSWKPEVTAGEIVSMSVSGGYLDGVEIAFSRHLNTVIGGRGTGKSTLLECLRYALDIPPKGRQAQKLHLEIVKENLGKASGRIEVEIVSSAQHGKRYRVSRRYGEMPIVREAAVDGSGNVSTLQARDLLPGIDIYGQNEIYELAQDEQSRIQLLDRFLPNEGDYAQRSATLKKRLQENQQKLVKTLGEIDDLKAQIARLPKLVEQLQGFQVLGIQEKLARTPLFARERQIVERTREEIQHLRDSLASLRDNLPDLTFISDQALKGLPDAALLNPARTILDKLRQRFEDHLAELTTELTNGERQLVAQLALWKQSIAQGEAELEKALRSLPATAGKSGQEVGTAYQRLLQDIERIKPLETRLANYDKLLESQQQERRNLLAELSDLRGQRTKSLQNAAGKLNHRLAGKLKVEVRADADRTPLKTFLLESRLENIGEKRLSWIDERDAISPSALAQAIRDGLAELQDNWGLTPLVTEALTRLPKSRLMELEALQLDHCIEIFLNVSHDPAEPVFRPLDKLSTGQQCTAILHMLLLENVDPLIMDQPEDNLDNAFIAERIVHELRAAKTSRQFLFATHNANIPVFGDAEWIGVFTTMENHGSLTFEAQGSIDVPAIRDQVASILEGGRDAFIQRKEKYEF